MQERGALTRRRQGTQVLYRVADQALIEMCRSVCQRVKDARQADPSRDTPFLPNHPGDTRP